MRFLADENFPSAAVAALEKAGHDVVWIGAAAPGSSDLDVLAWAAREERVLLTFDKDFGVDEWHGHNVFFRDGERVFRTYFINNRGDEQMGNTWNYLDITALGRQETWEDSPEGYPQTPPYQWWDYHDVHDAAKA